MYVIKLTATHSFQVLNNLLKVYPKKPVLIKKGYRAVKLTPAIVKAAKQVLEGVEVQNDQGFCALPLTWEQFDEVAGRQKGTNATS